MKTRLEVPDRPEFDTTEHLNSEEDDPALLAAATGDMARARGMSQVTRDAGIAREALHEALDRALRPGSQTRFETISRVCAALGVRLVAQPMHQQASRLSPPADRSASFAAFGSGNRNLTLISPDGAWLNFKFIKAVSIGCHTRLPP